MANLILQGKNRSKNTPVPRNMDGDASKENWKDKEFQQQIKREKLTLLFGSTYIAPSEVEMIDFMLANYHEEAFGKKIILSREINVAEMKTKSGLIVAGDDFTGKYSGKHGLAIPEAQYPSHLGVVLAVGPECNYPVKRGDIVRFSRMSASEVTIIRFNAYIIYELDLQTKVGKWVSEVAQKPTKKK